MLLLGRGVVVVGFWLLVQCFVRYRAVGERIRNQLDQHMISMTVTMPYISLETDLWKTRSIRFQDHWYKFGKMFYDVGILCAVASQIGVISILIMLSMPLSGAPSLRKRDENLSQPTLVPVIPGITTPLSHAIPLFLTILASQAIHELGHAMAANLHRIKPMALGLTVIFPGIPIAHVGLPDLRGRLTRLEQLRVIAAGVWHNVCLICFLYIIIFSGITGIFWTDAHGLRITESNDPELAKWLPSGAIIHSINDYPVHSMAPGDRKQVWQRFLHDDLRSTAGWCIHEQDWRTASTACCQNSEPDKICFIAQESKCLDAATVLRDSARCNSTCDGLCAQVAPHESLAWIDVSYSSNKEQIILRGPFDTVSKSMGVSTDRAARWLRSMRLGHAEDRIAYAMRILGDWLLLINFTLCLLNMLPIGPLDGAAFLRLGLTEVYSRHYGDAGDTYQLETDLEEAQDTPWASQVRQVVLFCQAISVILIVIAVATNVYRAFNHIYLSL